MTDKTQTPTDQTVADQQQPEVVPTRLQKFVNEHPRRARAIAILGGVASVGGTLLFATNLRKNKHHINAAGQHVLEAGSEISEAVSPTSETTDA